MRRVKHILTYVLVLSMCFTLFFFPVKADAVYYLFAPKDNLSSISALQSGGVYLGTDSNNRRNYISGTSYDVKFGYAYLSSNKSLPYLAVYISPTLYNSLGSDDVVAYETDGVNLRALKKNWFIGDQTNGYYSNPASPFYSYSVNSSLGLTVCNDASDFLQKCNDGIDSPVEPINWGKPYDVEYATRIAGSGLASADNIDRIVWNRAVDTNGNELPTGSRVQIRAIPGKYVGNTANDVLTKTYTDFILDHSKQLIIVDIIASRGVYETKWSEVVDHFGFFPYSWVPNIQYIDNEYFKMGWIYQIRLQVDDYYSDWTNIYTATGSGASESQTITDSDELTQQLVQDINIVNQLNNTSSTNWYINETTINNSEYTENTNGKPWWAYLLEAILSLFQIDDGNQQTINNTNNLNIDLNDKLNEYNQIEDQQLDNLDNNLEAIEVQSDMLEDNKFIGSANWVATQYNRMTNGTVIGSLIGFSLLFGLALIFIGKIR